MLASPCTGMCRLIDGTATCAGCYRTMAEIVAWKDASDDEQRRILDALLDRRQRAGRDLPSVRGG